MSKKPNILWIMTDQQSFNMLSCAGNKYVHTPNLDKLAEQAVRFQNTYCTNPVCLPSRFSLFTGLYPADVGIRSNDCHNESKGIPKIVRDNGIGNLFKEQGYKTVYGGKEHLPFMSARDLGFEYLCEDERSILSETFAGYIREYDWEKPLFMVASFINPHDICLMAIRDFENIDMEKQSLYWRQAFEEAEDAQKIPKGMSEEEFFHTICPPLPENYEPSPDEPEAIDILQTDRIFKKRARENYSDRRWRIHRWAYAVLTNRVDAQIGKVLDALKESGKWDDTLIVFTSDHGDMDASHKMEHKEVLYQEACHVPLIIKGPGQKSGWVNEQIVSNGLDIIRTVMDYGEIAAPDYMRGKSLRDAVDHGSVDKIHDIIVIECENGIGAVSDRYKYVLYDKGSQREQFYDLAVNPGEMYNQIGEGCYAQTVEMFRKAINDHTHGRTELFIG
ncbi:MAG: sulfatase-like hydrolase/transferase [Roseburia sp.]|nr:sulfatase-like hydrolase/transferase [Roseburia sp.]